MRVMMMHKLIPNAALAGPPSPEVMTEMGRLIEDMTRAGVLVATGGFDPSALGLRLRFEDGKMTVTDGPFAEAKEMIAGFALVEVKSLNEALEWAPRFAKLVGDVEIHVRPLGGPPPNVAAQ